MTDRADKTYRLQETKATIRKGLSLFSSPSLPPSFSAYRSRCQTEDGRRRSVHTVMDLSPGRVLHYIVLLLTWARLTNASLDIGSVEK